MDNRKDTTPEALAQAEPARPALMRFPSGAIFAPGWTGNPLVDDRHAANLAAEGCTPAEAEHHRDCISLRGAPDCNCDRLPRPKAPVKFAGPIVRLFQTEGRA